MLELILPPSADDMELPINDESRLFLEGFASGVASLMKAIDKHIGDHRKASDPLTVLDDRTRFYSYFFDLKSGGRHHEFSEYSSFLELLRTIVEDGKKTLREYADENIS